MRVVIVEDLSSSSKCDMLTEAIPVGIEPWDRHSWYEFQDLADGVCPHPWWQVHRVWQIVDLDLPREQLTGDWEFRRPGAPSRKHLQGGAGSVSRSSVDERRISVCSSYLRFGHRKGQPASQGGAGTAHAHQPGGGRPAGER